MSFSLTDAAVSEAVSLKTYAPVSPKTSRAQRENFGEVASQQAVARGHTLRSALPCNDAVPHLLKTFGEEEEGSIETGSWTEDK